MQTSTTEVGNHPMTDEWSALIDGESLPTIEDLTEATIQKDFTAEEFVDWVNARERYSGILQRTADEAITRYAVPELPEPIQKHPTLLPNIRYDIWEFASIAVHANQLRHYCVSEAQKVQKLPTDRERMALIACIEFGMGNYYMSLANARYVYCIKVIPDFETQLLFEKSEEITEALIKSSTDALAVFLEILPQFKKPMS